MTAAHEPSLFRFLQDRLDDDVNMVLRNTPVFGVQVAPEFEARHLDRGSLLHQVRAELAVLAETVEAMRVEQGTPPPEREAFEAGPVTVLGDAVLRLLALKYSDHPDYREDWRPLRPVPELRRLRRP